ncbi:MAG: hypothetical protein Q4F56_01950 [Candidatus Saccharibacteria bacterium]|nr:hypothetical protein [Candidatus Saccharibacteria bacterium]
MENSDNMFTVMPMNQRFTLEPGQVYEGTIKVVNPADAKGDFKYKATVTPYGVMGSDYQADLATITNQSAIVDWITIENPTGSVKPNGYEDIKFKITVPADAAGGGQYATIAISSDAKTEASDEVTVNNVFEMASIIYANVNGEIKHEGEIKDNYVPGFVTTAPVTVSATFTNTGNVHEDATVIIKATNFFTGEVILPTEENEGEYSELIMPGTERVAYREIDNLPALGVVNVDQTVYYMGTVSTVSSNVIICPIWFLALVVLTIAALVTVVVRIVLKHKKKKALVES